MKISKIIQFAKEEELRVIKTSALPDIQEYHEKIAPDADEVLDVVEIIDEAIDDTETLEATAEILERAQADKVKVTDTTIELVNESLMHFSRKYDLGFRKFATESEGGDSSEEKKPEAAKMADESKGFLSKIWDKIKALFKWIGDVFKRMYEAIKKFFARLFGKNKEIQQVASNPSNVVVMEDLVEGGEITEEKIKEIEEKTGLEVKPEVKAAAGVQEENKAEGDSSGNSKNKVKAQRLGLKEIKEKILTTKVTIFELGGEDPVDVIKTLMGEKPGYDYVRNTFNTFNKGVGSDTPKVFNFSGDSKPINYWNKSLGGVQLKLTVSNNIITSIGVHDTRIKPKLSGFFKTLNKKEFLEMAKYLDQFSKSHADINIMLDQWVKNKDSIQSKIIALKDKEGIDQTVLANIYKGLNGLNGALTAVSKTEIRVMTALLDITNHSLAVKSK